MKNIMFGLVLISTFAFAHEYDYKDMNGNKEFEIKDGVIRDNNWNKLGEIDEDGYIRDKNYNRVGRIERKDNK